ncbi:SelT/SelW/SelH family protein [Salinisphaera orenii]|uniref:SelT/SelW/SelH family protein n=1 Tax=Salinisphaera orenii TaxID=856731 RepID=UPI00296FCFE7
MMSDIEQPRLAIHYCPRCGWLTRAAWMAQEIGKTFEADLAEIALVPDDAGVFDVWLDAERVFCRAEVGDFPAPKTIKQHIRDRVAPARELGHSDR